MSSKFRSKKSAYRSALCSLAAIATSCVMLASACSQATSSTDKDEDSAVTRVDEQVLANGNFEYFDDNDGTYLISSPNNWSASSGSGVDKSASMSGIIGTSYDAWAKLTDASLPETLWKNNALDTEDENYVDYNGLSPEDLPFANPAAAIVENENDDKDDDSDDYVISDNPEDAAYISNPYTHLYRWGEKDGKAALYDNNGNEVEYWTDDDGKYYTSSDMTKDSLVETNVLMIHNYVEDNKQGSETYYSSSTTLTLEANTAGKFSVWVKTSDLYFGSNNDTRTEVQDQRGAYITVNQTVGGNSIDKFSITNINTQKLNAYDEQSGTWEKGNNGWVEYTIYVSACNYATTTVTITVGLGQASNYTVEGYAFFDDMSFEKYFDYNEMVEGAGGQSAFDTQTDGTTCDLSSEAEDKIFRVDREIFNQTGSSSQIFEHFSGRQQFYIDLASEAYENPLAFSASNLTAGLTVDADNYICSNNNSDINYIGDITNSTYANTYLPSEMSSINLAEDVLANLTVTSSSSWSSNIGGNYQTIIDDALRSAADLPGASADGASTLLMLSSRGAAYESVIYDQSNPLFTVGGGEYKIVSFWIKTNDMGGSTAATVTVRQHGKDSNSSNFTVDSTTVDAVTINDKEDVYNGWVQCFALVSNTTETEQQFEIVVNFGNTTIKGTTSASYRGGWVAVSNLSYIDVSETAYGYADTETRAASIEINEASETEGSKFDSTFGNGKEIETSPARPSNYNGVNGNSASVKDTVTQPTDFDKLNDNAYAGLINKDYFEAYKTYFADLLTRLDASSPLNALFGQNSAWDSVIGSTTQQPLLIVNTVREIANQSDIYNYGFYANSASVSSDTYLAVSVKVKVSEGAYATVYLVDTDTKRTLSFETPEYTFWYDNDGNVLKGEPDEDATRPQQRENIAYKLRADGLYEDEDGNLYANIYNLEHEYYDERATYYDEDGNSVAFDYIDEDKIYYADAAKTAYAPHYLVTSDGTRVYSYVSGLGSDRVYNYFVNNAVDTSLSVKGFDTSVAQPRYTSSSVQQSPYSFTIDAIANPSLANKWITVNFFIHTGNQALPYRLEVWSGSRDTLLANDKVVDGSYVLFDYSTVSLDESTYTSLVSHYSDEIIRNYQNELIAADSNIQFASDEENIAYYEKLAAEKGVSVNSYNYSAQYYTYTLYDSQSYVPFNENTAAEDERGYNYVYGDYAESLAVLKVEDLASSGSLAMNMFIDYSTVNKDISITSTSDVEEEETTSPAADATNVWLLVSSIVLVVAILVAIGALVTRDILKKRKFRKTAGKNTFNFKKNKRYVRSYVKEHGETKLDEKIDDAENSESAEAQGESAEGEQLADEQTSVSETADEQSGAAEESASDETQTSQTEDKSDGDKNN